MKSMPDKVTTKQFSKKHKPPSLLELYIRLQQHCKLGAKHPSWGSKLENRGEVGNLYKKHGFWVF